MQRATGKNYAFGFNVETRAHRIRTVQQGLFKAILETDIRIATRTDTRELTELLRAEGAILIFAEGIRTDAGNRGGSIGFAPDTVPPDGIVDARTARIAEKIYALQRGVRSPITLPASDCNPAYRSRITSPIVVGDDDFGGLKQYVDLIDEVSGSSEAWPHVALP